MLVRGIRGATTVASNSREEILEAARELLEVMERMGEMALTGKKVQGTERTVIAGLGQVLQEHRDEMSLMPGVDEVIRVSKPYKLSSRETHPSDTVVDLPYGVRIGDGHPVFM